MVTMLYIKGTFYSTIAKRQYRPAGGFTLVELSVVLVIIGLIIGAIMVGKDLINEANLRATISQLEKYNTAVHTFRLKYDDLPGDILASKVTELGFPAATTRGGQLGNGDGNGILQGLYTIDGHSYGWGMYRENLYFWEDISANSGFIDGSFNTATDTNTAIATGTAGNYFPQAKLGRGNYIGVYSCFRNRVNYYPAICAARNYFFMLGYHSSTSNGYPLNVRRYLSALEAYNIDAKIDDGLPRKGKTRAFSPNATGANSGGGAEWSPNAATSDSTTCFEISTTDGLYSTSVNGGAGMNCVLSTESKIRALACRQPRRYFFLFSFVSRYFFQLLHG